MSSSSGPTLSSTARLAGMVWNEVADGVFLKRYEPFDINVSAILGPTGVTVVDTRNSPAEARQIVDDVSDCFDVPIVAAVNTHAHYDHSFGNSVFADLGIPVIGHHLIPAHFKTFEGPRLAAWRAEPAREPDKKWEEVVLTPPSVLVHQSFTLTQSGREIECRPIAPGHTDTDIAVFVPDARVWMLGDVIEESGPPMFGSGSWPLDWSAALEKLLLQIQPTDVIVPGHGQVVDRAFVSRQAAALCAVADAIHGAWVAGNGIEDALHATELPWPKWMLRSAFQRGYSHLAQRSLG